jgi:alpha-tubulin suppressor-like RCC1 family protein
VSACGSHACGIRTDGTLWCWGANQYGQLGDGTTTESLEPAQVGTSAGWSSVSVRTGTTCGIRDQTVSCWGNGYGTAPVTVGVGTPFDEVASGQVHECALSAGRLYCWGTNFDGNLGTGDQTSRSTPTRIGTADDWTALALSSRTSCGLRAGGQLWCWGANEYGVFGDGTSFYPSPMLVPLPAAP